MSMQTVASPAMAFTPPKRNSLTHIPGDEGWPVIGKTFDVLADPKGQVERSAAKYGLVYRSHIFGETSLVLLGPEANELVLFDQAKQFSSAHGWGRILGLLFPRGLMLLDFEEHRLHRRALSVAFKSGPMKSYLTALDAGIAARVAQWKAKPGPMLFLSGDEATHARSRGNLVPRRRYRAGDRRDHPRFRRHGGRLDRGNPQAAARHQKWRAASGDANASWLTSPSRFRSAAPKAVRICFRSYARPPMKNGALLSTQDIVDHMSFLMMAAHDTLTSSLTSFVAALAAHPEWQGKLREEIAGLGIAPGETHLL